MSSLSNRIFTAAKNGDIVGIRHLLKKEGIDKEDKEKALRWSAKEGHLEIVKLLIQDTKDKEVFINKALDIASTFNQEELLNYLLQIGGDVKKGSPLSVRNAARNGHTNIIRILLKANGNFRADKDAALKIADKNKHEEALKLLIAAYPTKELRFFLQHTNIRKEPLQKELETRNTRIIQSIRDEEPTLWI